MTVQLSDAQWRDRLNDEQFRVLREKATERPFSGELLQEHRRGNFVCAACGAVVFGSGAKFDSGSGWPSFYEPANSKAVILRADDSHGHAPYRNQLRELRWTPRTCLR